MSTHKALFAVLIVPSLFVGNSFAQEQFAPKMEPIPIPGVAGTVPNVLSIPAISPFSGAISPKEVEALLNRIPNTERKIRGVHDVELFKELSPSVVLVQSNKGMGSGSVIAGDLILTNWHVVAESTQVGVIFKPSSQDSQVYITKADVIKVDQVRDLALLKPLISPINPLNRLIWQTKKILLLAPT
jgi:S1-C subfamily serine protease